MRDLGWMCGTDTVGGMWATTFQGTHQNDLVRAGIKTAFVWRYHHSIVLQRISSVLPSSSEATLLPPPPPTPGSHKIMYDSSALYSIFCSSKLLQTCYSIRQRKGSYYIWCTLQNARDLSVSPYSEQTRTQPADCLRWSIKVWLLCAVWQMLLDLSKTLFSVGFQKLVWTDQKLHLSCSFICLFICFCFVLFFLLWAYRNWLVV